MSTKIIQNGLQLKADALTICGKQRSLNEDTVFHQTVPTPANTWLGLYMVCDGLGGHQAGEVASQLAVDTIADEASKLIFDQATTTGNFTRPSAVTLQQFVKSAILKANDNIINYANSHRRQAGNLGTTITLALIYENAAYIANVGDSRTYLYRAGQVTQITRDHSVAAELVRLGKIEPDEMANHPQRNMLYRSLGMYEAGDLEIDMFEQSLEPGDRLLLCSDGLWQAFAEADDLALWLGAPDSPAEICQQLTTKAYRRNGSDDVSAIVVRVEGHSGNQTAMAPQPVLTVIGS